MHVRVGILVLLVALLCLLSLPAVSQTNATVSGVITDQHGLTVPGVSVVLTSLNTNVTYHTETNELGIYRVLAIPPGVYRANVMKAGFAGVVKSNIELHVQDQVSINFQLRVGSVSENVTVEGGAPMVNTQDATVSTVVDRHFADTLPLNGRTFQALINLSPGVTPNAGAGASGYSIGQFTVNGQRPSSNYWTVDGAGANIGTTPWSAPLAGAAGGLGAFNVLGGTNSLVSVDALQEFRIQTSTYAPEFGRTPGGQISIATRSGTNQFHGSIFDYFRNTVLDATDWFANHYGLPKAGEKQNDFGGVLGGPLIKNKTFFFFSYEGMRVRQPQIALTTVPTPAARQNAIPAIQPYINAYPLPNPGAEEIAPGLAPFNATYSNPSTVDAYSLRIDHTLAKSLSVFGRYNYSPSHASQRAASGTTANTVWTIDSTTRTLTVGATWAKSSQAVDEVRFNYSTSGGQTASHMDTFGGGTVAPGDNLFPSPLTYKNAVFGLFMAVGSKTGINVGGGFANEQHQYNVVNTLSLQKGSHSLKFGIDYRRLSPDFDPREYGLYAGFSDVASLEAGNTLYTIVMSNASGTFLFHNLGVFAQDTWRVTSRLTLTYGLRDDVDFMPTTENGPSLPAVTGFSLTDFSHLALAPAGTPVYSTRFANLAPRIGVAYQVGQRQGRETVLRGGFGVFYDLSSTEIGGANLGGYPFVQSAYRFGAPFPTPPSAAAAPAILPPDATQGTLFGFDPHLNQPYTLQWNFALEQSVGQAQTLTASYVGSSGRRLLATELTPNPNPNYLLADLVNNAGSSNYNALQLQFQRRMAKGLQALVSYSWAHSIDTGSYGEYASIGNTNENRGDSDFDIRQTFSAALTYNLPAFGRNAFARALLGGWSLQNSIQARSAPPVDILDYIYIYQYQGMIVNLRPDVVAGQPFYLSGSQYPGGKALNPNAFTNLPLDATTGLPLRQGNLGRNSLRAFGLTQWDFAVHRDFPIHEAVKLQLRAEMFNVLNHPNFAPYSYWFNAGDPYFGQSTKMLGQATVGDVVGNGGINTLHAPGGPRNIQLALKLVF